MPAETHKAISLRTVKRDTSVKLTIAPKNAERKKTGLLFDRIDQVSCPHCGHFVTLSDAKPLTWISCAECHGRVFVTVRLANFLIHSNIGEGEMGTIYRATDETLGREVAIKLLRGSYAEDPESCERLRKEACALGKLNHPRVAQVYALNFSNGHPYLVMEWVSGEDFDRKLQQEGHLDERVVLRMATDVAEGLVALNREGLVHSDIKPANIVMDRDGNSKLVDFGLTGMSRYDKNHNIMGTPDYIAPELIQGDPDTPRSDIFSLGATLYHLLSGHPPTQGESATDVLKARLEKKEVPPLHDVSPHVSRATCKMVMKMLEYSPEERLQNSDILLYQIKEAQKILDLKPLPGESVREDQPLTEHEKQMLEEEGEEKDVEHPSTAPSYFDPPPSPLPDPVAQPPQPEADSKPKRKSRVGCLLFSLLFFVVVGSVILVQFPPFDKMWDRYYRQMEPVVQKWTESYPRVQQALTWSGQKLGHAKFLLLELVGTVQKGHQAPLLPPLSDFTVDQKMAWMITNVGEQPKSGSTMQSNGALMIQLPGVGVDKWASWRYGYSHARYIWTKVSTNCFAFSGRLLAVASQNPLDATGIQAKASDVAAGPWVYFGLTGKGELFLQTKGQDNKVVVVKKDNSPVGQQPYLMLVRRGASFEALCSADNQTWSLFGRCQMDMPMEHAVGFATSTVDAGKMTTVKFDAMRLTSPAGAQK